MLILLKFPTAQYRMICIDLLIVTEVICNDTCMDDTCTILDSIQSNSTLILSLHCQGRLSVLVDDYNFGSCASDHQVREPSPVFTKCIGLIYLHSFGGTFGRAKPHIEPE